MVGYVSIDESDEYVSTHYTEDSDERTRWENLDEEDKRVLLLVSYESINRLPFPGRRTSPTQEGAFPRYPSSTVPQDVKYAQIENAVAMSDTSTHEDQKQYDRLWNLGVSSYSIGNLSETFVEGGGSLSANKQNGIESPHAQRLLTPYLGGGYRI